MTFGKIIFLNSLRETPSDWSTKILQAGSALCLLIMEVESALILTWEVLFAETKVFREFSEKFLVLEKWFSKLQFA